MLNEQKNELEKNESIKKEENEIPFWYENPNILFVQNYILELLFWHHQYQYLHNMTYF